jgi:PRTRC genetic system ThiF family protein
VKYITPYFFLEEAPTVVLVGAGGTGSAMVTGLADMCQTLPLLGGQGLNVIVMDDDKVSASNIGRQAFARSDVGQYKAQVIVNRVNQMYGLEWVADLRRLKPDTSLSRHRSMKRPTIFIGCVDTRAARAAINAQYIQAGGTAMWLDCGNEQRYGQIVLGAITDDEMVLPSVADIYPEIIDPFKDSEDTGPSCSLPEALAKQDLFTNRLIANTACNLLWKLFRYGETEVHGAFVNVENMRTNPIAIDPVVWERMGFAAKVKKPKEAAEKSGEIALFEPETA